MHIFGIFLFRSFQASFCVSASHTIILVRLVNHRHAECAGCRIRQCKFPQLGNPIRSFLTRFGTQELSIPGRASTFEPVPLQDIVKVMFRFRSSLFFLLVKRPVVSFLYLKSRRETGEMEIEISSKYLQKEKPNKKGNAVRREHSEQVFSIFDYPTVFWKLC